MTIYECPHCRRLTSKAPLALTVRAGDLSEGLAGHEMVIKWEDRSRYACEHCEPTVYNLQRRKLGVAAV